MLKRFVRNLKGSTAVEYALVASLIAIAAIAGFQALGNDTNALFHSNESEITNALS